MGAILPSYKRHPLVNTTIFIHGISLEDLITATQFHFYVAGFFWHPAALLLFLLLLHFSKKKPIHPCQFGGFQFSKEIYVRSKNGYRYVYGWKLKENFSSNWNVSHGVINRMPDRVKLAFMSVPNNSAALNNGGETGSNNEVGIAFRTLLEAVAAAIWWDSWNNLGQRKWSWIRSSLTQPSFVWPLFRWH